MLIADRHVSQLDLVIFALEVFYFDWLAVKVSGCIFCDVERNFHLLKNLFLDSPFYVLRT